MNSKFRNRCHKHFPIEYNLHWDKSAWLYVMALKRVIESCFWPLQAFSVHSLWRKRSNTCVWLFLLVGQKKKKFIKKNKKQKWGLKSHAWLLEPATTFSLTRKSRRSLHLHFLSFLDTGASVKMCSPLQAEKWQHFWVSLTTAYQKKPKKQLWLKNCKENDMQSSLTEEGSS